MAFKVRLEQDETVSDEQVLLEGINSVQNDLKVWWLDYN